MKIQANAFKGSLAELRQRLANEDPRTFEYMKRSALSEAAALEAARQNKGVRFNGKYYEC